MPERRPRLQGKVAIVTGAGARSGVMGNGKATSILFAREGAKVLLVDQIEERVKETLRVITAEAGEASIFVADVTNAGDCQAMVEAAAIRYGHLDILHNNVGVNGPGSVIDVSEEEWDRVMRINLSSMIRTSKYAIPEMVVKGGGAIVNISSISAIRPRGMTPYTVSKAGVINLTKFLATHLAPNFRVNCVAPGGVEFNQDKEFVKKYSKHTPLNRMMRKNELNGIIEFLCSSQSSYVTGATFVIDGGWTCW